MPRYFCCQKTGDLSLSPCATAPPHPPCAAPGGAETWALIPGSGREDLPWPGRVWGCRIREKGREIPSQGPALLRVLPGLVVGFKLDGFRSGLVSFWGQQGREGASAALLAAGRGDPEGPQLGRAPLEQGLGELKGGEGAGSCGMSLCQ